MRTIGAVTHGLIDYTLVILLIAAPSVAQFAGRQATICYLLAVVHLVLTLVTRFPLGAMKLVRFPIHGAIELLAGILMIVLPWLANFSRGVHSRDFFVIFGVLVVVLWFATRYRQA